MYLFIEYVPVGKEKILLSSSLFKIFLESLETITVFWMSLQSLVHAVLGCQNASEEVV